MFASVLHKIPALEVCLKTTLEVIPSSPSFVFLIFVGDFLDNLFSVYSTHKRECNKDLGLFIGDLVSIEEDSEFAYELTVILV